MKDYADKQKLLDKYSTGKEPMKMITMLTWVIVLLTFFMVASWVFGAWAYIYKIDEVCNFNAPLNKNK